MKTVVVVPSIREDQLEEFLAVWHPNDVEFIVVQDGGGKPFDLDIESRVTLYGWEDIDAELGEDAWIIPRRSDCIRSFGIWKAWQAGADVIVSMDDDVRPVGRGYELFSDHDVNLNRVAELGAWHPTIRGVKPRGEPFFNRKRGWPVVLSHGLWKGTLDLDAVTQLTRGGVRPDYLHLPIPVGRYFAMCGMNVAFRQEIAPLMYFGLQGRDYPYDRFGDIWCGVIAKKILDRFHLAVWSGMPHVKHERASNVWANLRKEQPGYLINEDFWEMVDDIMLRGLKTTDCYLEIAGAFRMMKMSYFQKLGKAMEIWAGLFR